jgi:hypothetical protein
LLFMSEKQKDVSARRHKKLFSPKTGELIGQQRRVFAEFRKGGVPAWALPRALEVFKMNGKPPEIPAQMWLCVYDSAEDQRSRGWTAEERELIEETLLAQGDVFLIELPRIEAPTPAYVKQTSLHGQRKIEQVVARAVEIVTENEYDPAAVIAFERQENRKESEAIIAALEALAPVEDEAEPLIAA